MQHVLIVEDNNEQRNMLITTIKDKYPSWIIDYVDSYNEAFELIKYSITKTPFDLFLLDVQLTDNTNDRGGFLLAKEIRSIPIYYKTSILFLTGITDSSSFALSNFHCYDYVTKPYTREDILNRLEQLLLTGYLENSFTISDIDRIIHKVKSSDIIYVHSLGHLKTIYLKNSHICTRSYKFKEIIELSDGELVICHKGYLINPKYITSFDKLTRSVIIDSKSIPIGKKYINQISAYIKDPDFKSFTRKDIQI